ncbi:MAG: DUF4365 domain-containing protein [Clostridia bacterium]|nr:DUF4365 domain-containing protein [Clostridia bacterium]
MNYEELLGRLPQRNETHIKNDRGRLAFRNLFTDPFFLVREEHENDYGVDICIEAIVNEGKSPTNIRTQVQLKSSNNKKNSKGYYSYNISISNLNYLVNHPCSFYAFYSIIEDKFYYCNAEDVYLQYKAGIVNDTNSITVHFKSVIDADFIRKIHQNLIETTLLFKDIRIKLNESGLKPGTRFVYGELIFESSTEMLEDYFHKKDLVYAYTTDENGKVIFMHNLIWESHHGYIPRGYRVYHVNGNTLDNRSENLDIMKTIEMFDLEGFQKEIEESQAYNILTLIIEGRGAELKDVPPPPKAMLYEVMDALKKNGWSVNEKGMKKIKRDMEKYLGMKLD